MNYRKYLIIVPIMVLTVLIPIVDAVIPTEEWNKTFEEAFYANSALQTQDSGYIIIGYSDLHGVPDADSWLVKTDENGNKLWSKKIGKKGDLAYSIEYIPSEGYIIAGTEYHQDSIAVYSYGWLVKTDLNGNELWNKTYRIPSSDRYSMDIIASVHLISDGGYILAGQTTSPDISTNGGTTLLIKTDNFGNELWNKSYGIRTIYSWASYSEQTIDGGYIIGGGSYNPTHDALIVKTDGSGNETWNKSFKGLDRVNSIRQTSDRGYIITGYYRSPEGTFDGWIIKIDINGDESWNRTYGGNGYDGFWSIEQTNDRGYIAVGFTGTGSEGWLVKVDKNGNDIWNKTFGAWRTLKSAKQTSDGGYILSGMTQQNQAITRICCEMWLVKLSREDNIPPTISVIGDNPITIYIDSEYTDSGATATDNFDGIVPIISTGSVDTNTIGIYTITYTTTDSAGNSASITRTIKVIYNFAGFFQPIDNLPTWNSINAGGAVPIKFSLNGNQGLDIFTVGYPASQNIGCDSSEPIDPIEETVVAGSSSLSYNATTDKYSYVWKTDKAWKNSCRQLTALLKDGTYHNASLSLN